MLIKNNYIVENLIYSVNDIEFYMSAYSIKDKKMSKIKITKVEFLNWCKSLEDDEQGWELSEYQVFYDILQGVN